MSRSGIDVSFWYDLPEVTSLCLILSVVTAGAVTSMGAGSTFWSPSAKLFASAYFETVPNTKSAAVSTINKPINFFTLFFSLG